MNDALVVRVLQSIGGLLRNRQRFIERDRALRDAFSQRRSLHQLKDQGAFFHTVDGRNVGVVERGEDLGFTVKAGEAVGIVGERRWQQFDGDFAIQLGVRGTPHFAHPTFAELTGDPVMSDALLRAHLGAI
jgi:hypothetical protein